MSNIHFGTLFTSIHRVSRRGLCDILVQSFPESLFEETLKNTKFVGTLYVIFFSKPVKPYSNLLCFSYQLIAFDLFASIHKFAAIRSNFKIILNCII